ncbi:unnamed protein product [Withania somnifera]
MLNFDTKITENMTSSVCPKPNVNSLGNMSFSKFNRNHTNGPCNYGNNNNTESINGNNAVAKRFKTLPAAETLPRNEVLGGYIFVCNNETMQEDLKRQLFGLPPRYKDSVRAITPGLPLFLYNYTTHQLHGIFEVRIHFREHGKPLEKDAFRPVLLDYDGPKFSLALSVPETLDLLDLCGKAKRQSVAMD